MEKYVFKLEEPEEFSVVLGNYYHLVHKKHIAAYGDKGASNIVNNVTNTYKNIQQQLANPNKNSNILLVGKVQSGKTSNLEMFTALAFDNGYNILVIYGGYDNALLKQTTDRFKDTFDISDEPTYEEDGPAIFTTDDNKQILNINDEMMSDLLESNKPVIFVSMKRPVAMGKINALFRKLDTSKFKAFIIDDEGDQASLNTEKDKIKKASATYKAIVEMKDLLKDPMYLSVTATPQANIFLDNWSKLRPDSIRLIQPGIGYDGAGVYHLYENNIVNIISAEDNGELKQALIPDSLRTALQYFIIASAIKRQRATNSKECYSDMIVHAFREVSKHNSIFTSIDNYIKTIKDSFEYKDESMGVHLSEFKKCYEEHLSPNVRDSIAFDELIEEIITVVRKVNVILKNGIGKNTQGNEKLKWHKIYIGGDLLQRGLTFPNLITTYFTRWATNGGNMDTNLQRARWFGYRSKYIDICKIFTTAEIAKEFTNLAEIEEDLWDQFADVENGTLAINDILIQSEGTNQNPTSKQRVKYKKINFKNRWLKQKFLVANEDKINENNIKLQTLFDSVTWKTTTAGSNIGAVTAHYAYFDASTLKKLINVIYDVFDYEPFQKKALVDLLGQDNIPVILMGNDKKARYRSIYENDFRIKALLQGANSTVPEKITYVGDSSVIIDKDKINIQIHRIVPGIEKYSPMESKEQYMFAVYIPKEKKYFIRED